MDFRGDERFGRTKDPYCLSPGMRKSATAIWRRFMFHPAARHRVPSRAVDACVCERSKRRAQDDTGGGARCLWPEQLRRREEGKQSNALLSSLLLLTLMPVWALGNSGQIMDTTMFSKPARPGIGEVRIVVDRDRCLYCGACVAACPPDSIYLRNGTLTIDATRCTGCARCARMCPVGALTTSQAATPNGSNSHAPQR